MWCIHVGSLSGTSYWVDHIRHVSYEYEVKVKTESLIYIISCDSNGILFGYWNGGY